MITAGDYHSIHFVIITRHLFYYHSIHSSDQRPVVWTSTTQETAPSIHEYENGDDGKRIYIGTGVL